MSVSPTGETAGISAISLAVAHIRAYYVCVLCERVREYSHCISDASPSVGCPRIARIRFSLFTFGAYYVHGLIMCV